MYADVNQPGQIVQKSLTGETLTPPPDNAAFTKRWKFQPSPSAREPLGAREVGNNNGSFLPAALRKS